MAYITSMSGTVKTSDGQEIEFVLTSAGENENGAYMNVTPIGKTKLSQAYDTINAIAESLDHDGMFGGEEW